jgi:hypothetical protein
MALRFYKAEVLLIPHQKKARALNKPVEPFQTNVISLRIPWDVQYVWSRSNRCFDIKSWQS